MNKIKTQGKEINPQKSQLFASTVIYIKNVSSRLFQKNRFFTCMQMQANGSCVWTIYEVNKKIQHPAVKLGSSICILLRSSLSSVSEETEHTVEILLAFHTEHTVEILLAFHTEHTVQILLAFHTEHTVEN